MGLAGGRARRRRPARPPGLGRPLRRAAVAAFMRVWCLVSRRPPFLSLRPAACAPSSPLWGEEPWFVWSLLTAARLCCDRKQVELMAARDNAIPVVMCCGAVERDASAGGHKFVDDAYALKNLEWLVDVTKAEAADPADKTRILGQIAAAEGGAAGLSSDISGWISGAVAAAAEVHNARSAAAKAAVTSIASAAQAAMCGEPDQLAALPAGQLPAAVRMAVVGAEAALAGLVGRGAPVDKPDHDGMTALMNAARAGWAGVVPVLVGGGAEVNLAKVPEEATALYFAAEAGWTKAVAALLAVGAEVDKPKNDGATPLFMAAQKGHAEVVAALLAAGAEVDKADDNGATPLFQAAQVGHAEVVPELLAVGAAVDKADDRGLVPLYMAAKNGHAEVAAALLAAGADRSLRARSGRTPLDGAKMEGHAEVVSLLR